jgi:uncharacterized protein (TIGR02453 family)
MAGQFTGFPPEAITFFKQLARHNNREWFQTHKDVYEQACREPMKALVADIGPGLGATKITRINRDIRFSNDRSPYRTYIAAGVRGNYVSLSTEGLYVGTGMYKPEPAALQRLRAAIDSDASGRALHKIVTSLRRKGYTVDTHDTVASAPRGYSADHPRIDLLRMKDIFAGKTFAPQPWLSTPKAIDRIRRVMTDIKPLGDWLRQHVGSRQS